VPTLPIVFEEIIIVTVYSAIDAEIKEAGAPLPV